MLIKSILVAAISWGFVNNIAIAGQKRDLNILLTNDREERVLKINELAVILNESLENLNDFKDELVRSEEQNKIKNAPKIVIRNASAALAAVGVITTIIFQSKGVRPSKLILAGGYSISALSAFLSYIENRAVYLTKDEIQKLRNSILALEKRTEIEKRNLSTEVRLLCLEDGGTLDGCALLNFI